MIDITTIIEAMLVLIMAIVSVIIIPKLNDALNDKLDEAELNALKSSITIAVRAAEQIYKNTPKSGVTKKQYVLDYLAKQGYTVNVSEVSTLIEAIVNELFPISNEGE